MIDQRRNAPRRYFVDAQGERVLIGLSPEETAEFEALDGAPGEALRIGAEIGVHQATGAANDVRWLALYSKHEGAWRTWMLQSQAERTQDLGFVNHA